MSFWENLGLSAGDSFLSGASDALFGGIKAKRNWKYKKKEMALQQQYNVENMERQYGYQVDMLNRQNQWNAPTNQVSMWRQAGISPTAVFGSGNGGVGLSGAPSGPSSSNPSASGNVDNSQAVKSAILSEAKRLQNETKVAASVAEKNEADADAARAAAARDQADADTKNLFRDDLLEGIRLDNVGKGFENRVSEQNAKLKEATTPAEIEKAALSLRNIVEDMNLKRAQVSEILSRIRLNEEYVKTEGSKRMELRESANLKKSQAYKTDIEAHTEKMIQDYKVAMASEGVNKIKADTAEAKARAKKVDAEIERLGKENKLTDAQIASIKDARREAWARYALDAGKRASEEAREWVRLAKSSLKDDARILDPNDSKSWNDPVTGKKVVQ